MAKRGRQSAVDAQQTKCNILTFASQLFSRKGYEATSLRDIADCANISHGLLRYHFGSKLEIWQAVADMAIASYTRDVMEPAMSLRTQGAMAALRDFCRRLVAHTARHPEMALIMKQESSEDSERLEYFLKLYEPVDKQIRALFEAAKSDGLYTHFETNFLMMTLFSMASKPFIDGCLIEKVNGCTVSDAEFVARYSDQLVALLFPVSR
jgi:AcrR family transcriptional regulator